MKQLIVAPSILAANFTNIGEAIKQLEDAKADWIHVDVMDGVFVPNISFGQKMVKDIRPLTKLPMDVHLMITEPIRYIDEFANNGADVITIHIEATQQVAQTLKKIKECGKKAGLSIKPNTPVESIKPYLDDIDVVLVMSVEPGFGGQKFMEIAIEKTQEVKKIISDRNILIEVDGGINTENVLRVNQAGADAVVAGSAVFKESDKAKMIRELKCL